MYEHKIGSCYFYCNFEGKSNHMSNKSSFSKVKTPRRSLCCLWAAKRVVRAMCISIIYCSLIIISASADDTKIGDAPGIPQENTIIDVMVLYTPQAAQAAEEGIQNRINQAVADGNLALQNSGIPITLNIVHLDEYLGISDTDWKTVFEFQQELENDRTVQTLREQFKADLVQLVFEGTAGNYWGYAPGWASVANVSKIREPFYTLVHEFSHSIGEPYVPSGYLDGMHNTAEICNSAHPVCTIMGKNKDNPMATIREPRFSALNAAYITQGAPAVAKYMQSGCRSTDGSLFCDVPITDKYYSDILEVYSHGITTGCDSSKTPYVDLPFCPKVIVDRAHFAVFVIRRIHDGNTNYQPTSPYRGYFSDVPSSHPQALWIEELYSLGLTNGSTSCSGSGFRYCPDNPVQRQELASLLMRAEYFLGNIPDYSTRPIRGYFDDIATNNEHLRAIEFMYEAGYTNGCYASGDGDILEFCPIKSIDRITAAIFMARIFRYRSIQALDPLEPDNSYSRPSHIGSSLTQQTRVTMPGTALVVGVPIAQQRNIAPVSDQDWVQFSLSAESAIQVATSGTAGDTRIWLYDSFLNQLAFDDDGGTGNFSLITRTCSSNPLPAGTYYIRVDEYGNNVEIPAYNLTMEVAENCQPNAPLSDMYVDTWNASLSPQAVFQTGERIWLVTNINNTSGSLLATVWDWIIVNSLGVEVVDMSVRDFVVNDLRSGLVEIQIPETVPLTLDNGTYIVQARVRTADGQFTLETSSQFNVVGAQSPIQVFLPSVRR